MAYCHWVRLAGLGFVAGITLTAPTIAAAQKPENLRQVLEQIGQCSKQQILVEPGLEVVGKLRIPAETTGVEKALEQIAGQVRDGAWVRLQMRAEAGKRHPSAVRLAAMIRKLRALPAARAVENVGEDHCLVVTAHDKRGPSATPSFYLLYRTRGGPAEKMEDELADIQDAQLALMEGLTPQETPNPMRAWAEALQGLDQDRMMRLVGPMAQAGDSLWQGTPPEHRQEILRDSMKVAKTYGGGLMAPPAANKPPAPRNYLPELKALVARLGEDRHARIMVEPSLFVARPPAALKADATLEEALSAALTDNRDIVWRRVHFARSEEGIPSAAELANEVRLWEGGGLLSLTTDAGSPRSVSLTGVTGPQETKGEVESLGEGRQTVYLIYGTTEHNGLPAAARLANLLRRQMEQMVRMSPEEVSNTMTAALQSYQGADEKRRERIMALPVMAGMMATWFPHAAKEGKLPPG